jgi:hypothetical protein
VTTQTRSGSAGVAAGIPTVTHRPAGDTTARTAVFVPAQPGRTVSPAPKAPYIPQQLRQPGPTDRVPRLRQIMGICGWAAVLGGVGLVIGIRGFVGILAGDAPAWYEPAIAVVGALGIGLTVTSFLSAHRRRVPWLLLGGASLVLAVGMAITVLAF